MGRVKELWQAERDKRWQQYYNDYCLDNFGGREVSGRDHDEASEYANELLEEDEIEELK